jgi:uncharacterized surface protein with fasciclin (FAS1) repeats
MLSKMVLVTTLVVVAAGAACGKKKQQSGAPPAGDPTAGSSAEIGTTPPPVDPNNIVNIALASKDHTTLVAALKAASYVTSVGNAGPLTVFAPTNAAFAKLPAGTVDNLLKPDQVEQLRNILKYHVTTTAWDAQSLKDGMELGMANGKNATIHIKDGKLMVNDATVVASIRASNGVIHVIDTVLIPPEN